MKPLLAAKATQADLGKLRFPLLASPKIDGIRCIFNNRPLSRTLKDIPNHHVRNTMRSRLAAAGYNMTNMLDGELITYNENGDVDDFSTISSKIMSHEGRPNYGYRVFDTVNQYSPFHTRIEYLVDKFNGNAGDFGEPLTHTPVGDQTELTELADRYIAAGYEGIMLRDPNGKYKFGRSTLNEQILVKYKLFDDDEFEVIGVTELMRNQNEAYANEVGAQKRSTAQGGLVPGGTMGTLVCKGKEGRPNFEVGTGFTQEQRAQWWKMQYSVSAGNLAGDRVKVKIKYQGYGPLGRPRFPVFLGIRADEDR